MKKYSPNDPDFYKPRGNMFTYATRGSKSDGTVFDYNFGGTSADVYPNTSGVGVNLIYNGGAAPSHGVYLKPPAHKVIYISGLTIFYSITDRTLGDEYFKETNHSNPPTDFSWLEMVHNGAVYCRRHALYGLALISESAPVLIEDFFGTGTYFFGQHLPLDCPGRFDGDAGEYLGLRTRYGTGLFLGNSFSANKLTRMHIMFTGWVVDKEEVDGAWEEVLQHPRILYI